MIPRIFLFFAVVFWGWTFVSTRVVLGFMTPAELLGLRLLIGLPILALVIYIKKLSLRFSKADLKPIAIGSLILTFHFMIQITGLKYTSATNTGWIISVTPLVLALLSFLFLKERIRVNQILGIVIATIGILLLVSKGDFSSFDWLSSVGDWLVLGSAHTWAIYTVVTRNVARRCHPLALTFAILVPSTVIMLTYMALTSDWQKFTNLPVEPLINLLFLGICGTALGHWFWQEGVARLGAARSGIFLYLEPIATMSLALPYLGEVYSSFTLFGGVLVLSGLFVAERIKAKS